MHTITVHKKIESETLHLPELRPLIGKTVQINVTEDPAVIASGTADWDAAMRAADALKDYDIDAPRQQREYDLKHAHDHLP